jgi:HSP20 family molecular chaperone IbpA
MLRANIRNRAFDRMGEGFAPLIDPNHFLGRSAFDIHYPHKDQVPPVNIKQDGKLFELELAIPGYNKSDLEVTVKDDMLTVSGEKRRSEQDNFTKYIFEEFNYSSFERSFKLDPRIAHEKITAKYENGILKLTFIDVPAEEEMLYQQVAVN